MPQNTPWLKRPKILLFIVVGTTFVLLLSFGITYRVLNLSIEKETNLSDIYSNIINIVILLLTVLVLGRLSEQNSKLDKSVTFEKEIILQRIQLITDHVEELYDIIESRSVAYQTLKREFDYIARTHKLVKQILKRQDSLLSGNKAEIDQCTVRLEELIDECRGVLLETPRHQPTATPIIPYITIANDMITIHDPGAAAARIAVNKMVDQSIELALLVNRHE